jgi:hypothetical protein
MSGSGGRVPYTRENEAAADSPRAARERHAGRNAVLCALLMTACLLAAHPFAEMGFDDDWSYARTAQVFSQTGHFAYNGWATAMLGWQVWWGALFIKLFGFSFAAVRLSTLPLAMLSAILFHQILTGCGIAARNAVLGTLTLVLSPLFLIMAASYMSDIPGLLCLLLCLYCCLRAVRSGSANITVAWLALASLASLAGGTARQIVWLGALVMVPATAWVLRRRKGVVPGAIALWAASAAAIYLGMHWYEQQPYSVPEHLRFSAIHGRMLLHLITEPIRIALCLLLVSLPVLSAWLPRLRTWPRRRQLALAAGLLAVTVFWIVSPRHDGASNWLMPWMLDIIGSITSLKQGYMLGVKPVTLGLLPRVAISLMVIAAGAVLLGDIVKRSRASPAALAIPEIESTVAPGPMEWTIILWITLPFSLCYVALLLFQGLLFLTLDRYLLELLAIGILLLLRFYQDDIAARMPAICWCVLTIFTLYSVAGLHDIFALQRARILASDMLLAAGVPRSAVSGGLEYDGWTQIMAGGYIHDPWIETPPGAAQPRTNRSDLPQECTYWFYPLTPAIEPKYDVTFSPLPCLDASAFPPVGYRAWLPPFHREIYILQRK